MEQPVELGDRPQDRPVIRLLRQREPAEPVRALLVAMPLAAISRPSIQLGLLAALGKEAGHKVETLHACLDFARLVLHLVDGDATASARAHSTVRGTDPYSSIADLRALLGDWLFSAAAFGPDDPDPECSFVLDRLDAFNTAPISAEAVLAIRRDVVPRFLDDIMGSVCWERYDVVGFTSTFQQNLAAVALATKIKAAHPDIVTLFGGANFDATMGQEYVRTVPAIDLAIQGEADVSFPLLLDALQHGRNVLDVPGVIGLVDGKVCAGPEPTTGRDMDSLPTPDYREYFDRAEKLELIPAPVARMVNLPFESARGCWWGAKVHCTFCGLNGASMSFRSKSPKRVIDELDELARRHGTFGLSAVDNIVDSQYLKSLFPQLVESEATYSLFYEVKADLSRADLELMARAGVHGIQPGIESLNSHVLGLMRKGTRAAWNVNVLRWSLHYGIGVVWNMLHGFPGELAQDYDDQLRAIPHLLHLPPPGGMARIWLERFSPLFTDGKEAGVDQFQPIPEYRHIYPEYVDLSKAAYYFDFQSSSVLADTELRPLKTAVEFWQERHRSEPRPTLTRYKSSTFIQIVDQRVADAAGVHTLEGPAAQLHEACMDRPRTADAVADQLGVDAGPVKRVLDGFVDRGLVFRDRALYLSLALPAKAP